MRHAAVAPVEHGICAIAHEHLAVVQVIVLDGLRDPALGQRPAQHLDVREILDQPALLLARQPRERRLQDAAELAG